ncbi:hypothetical protein B9Z55_003803 [Caenorhabditis nigoni]|uniref:Protein kinase domain-containing protein n=1 Tax=Caenorhabditis nigoni TaxID=1611254 RepID=A0A2G5VS81_9PELO|nr:hypothetical protein B9Z55_003803 [Caenorhabditis nigoni]
MPDESAALEAPNDPDPKKAPPQIINLPIGTIVGKKYKITHKLGEGGCGSVYKVEDTEDKTPYAMKVEFAATDSGNVLKMEVQVLTMMSSKKHVARCVASGKKKEYSYMVMTLLGESLDSIVSWLLFVIFHKNRDKSKFQIGYLHRDLKPANVALGYKGSADERFFLVLDFGLARQFITEKQDGKKMRRPREKALFRGTARYCSVAMHDRYEQGRVDDLWSLVYMLAELRCQLPWEDVDKKDDIGNMKRVCPDSDLFAKSPVQMLEFVKIVRNTQFYHRPEYDKLYKLLEEVMINAGYKWSDLYHWESEKNKENKVAKLSKLFVGKKGATTPTKDSAEGYDPNAPPYFTVEDFTSNPLGF